MRKQMAGSVLSVLLLLALLAAGPAPAGTRPQVPFILAQPGQAYIHTTTAGNLHGDFTYLDNSALDAQPNTKLFVTQSASPYGSSIFAPATSAQGLQYDPNGGGHRWEIINEDFSPMPVTLAWNVFIPPQDDSVFLHTSSSLNTNGSLTDIDNPLLNNNPSAVIFVQHVVNPGVPAAAASAVACCFYYTHTVAVTYDNIAQKWAIRNADRTNFPTDIPFNVLMASPDETFFTQTVAPANHHFSNATQLDNPLLNGNPDAVILLTQNAPTGVANDHQVALSYNTSDQHWYIYNPSGQDMPEGAAFNVLLIPPQTGSFLHTASAANSVLNVTFTDNLALNSNNPDLLVYVTHNYDPGESPNVVYDDHPLSVQLLHGAWVIGNLDGAPMQPGTTFNVYYTQPRGNAFSVSASRGNSTAGMLAMNGPVQGGGFNPVTPANTNLAAPAGVTGSVSDNILVINSPLLNSQPQAAPQSTFNATPAGTDVVITYTAPTVLQYGAASAWQVFHLGGPTFVLTQTYNILEPSPETSFVVTSSAPVGDFFELDNPLTNNHPQARVFVTRRFNGADNRKYVGVWYDTATDRWAIFNEDKTPMTSGRAFDVFVSGLQTYLPLIQK